MPYNKKYKALVLKYMACIFRLSKSLKTSDEEKRLGMG